VQHDGYDDDVSAAGCEVSAGTLWDEAGQSTCETTCESITHHANIQPQPDTIYEKKTNLKKFSKL